MPSFFISALVNNAPYQVGGNASEKPDGSVNSFVRKVQVHKGYQSSWSWLWDKIVMRRGGRDVMRKRDIE